MFYALFLGDCCLGKQCYEHCKYKYDKSSADIRICDLWGNTYKDNEDGVSGVVAFTSKGNDILKSIDCVLVEHPFDIVAEGQMKTCPKKIKVCDRLLESLRNERQSIETVCNIMYSYKNRQKQVDRIKHPIRTFKRIIKKVLR